MIPVIYDGGGIIWVASTTIHPPSSPRARLRSIRRGLRTVAASTFGSTRKPAEFTPIISMASICSVMRMLPISEAMFEPIFPARIRAIMVEQNSRMRLSLTMYPIYILSMIGSMRITEQIDAMDMMGVNSAGFLVLPKVTAATILSPLLMLLSLALGLVGGYVVVESTQIIPTASYITGIKAFYNGFYIFYSCFKMSLFCFMISSIAAFNGYYAKGGSLGVGRSSTKAIVTTSILILMADLIVTQLMLY